MADLQSLLAERRRGQLPFSLYKLYDKIDARLRQVSSGHSTAEMTNK